LISQFGSTACKALYRCDDCLETFDYFKCIWSNSNELKSVQNKILL
jgi:hypothetical protein